MARSRARSIARYAMPVKVWAQRFAVVLFVGAAFSVMLVGKIDSQLAERVRVGATDAFAPLLDALSEPIGTVNEAIDSVQELAVLREENQRLREANARLLQWERTARALEAQNYALRDLNNFIDAPAARYISARVIADPGGTYVRSLVINAGADEGVAKGQAALTGDGLVGRVTEVGLRAARVLLITDLNSRVPVRLERTRDRAILVGDNSDRPVLQYVPNDVVVSPGDRVVTSGDAGAFPPGLAVGTVAAVTDGMIRVQPFVDWNRLEYVRVVDFALPEILDRFLGPGGMLTPSGPPVPLGMPVPSSIPDPLPPDPVADELVDGDAAAPAAGQ